MTQTVSVSRDIYISLSLFWGWNADPHWTPTDNNTWIP